MPDARPTLLLSVDFEDWHQLVRRRVGVAGWEAARAGAPASDRRAAGDPRRAERPCHVLRARDGRARPPTAAETDRRRRARDRLPWRRPQARPHTDAAEFAQDLRAAKATIEDLTGRTPIGYRAPAFSITREAAAWAYEVLAQEGFAYDASQHDSPAIRDHAVPATREPHRLDTGLWEFPIAVWHPGPAAIPVGGASYWQILPTPLVLKGLERAGPYAGLYLHPNELDPQPLRPRSRTPPPPPSAPTPACARRSATAPAGARPECSERSRGGST